MPLLTRTFVKTSLLYLILALLASLLIAGRPALPGLPGLEALTPVSFHLFLVGWVTQLIFGVVYWMFPKLSMERPRGSERLAWATYLLLNAGLLLRVAGEPLNAAQPGAAAGWLLALSALLQWLAGLLFVINTWPRIKERRCRA